MNRQFRQLSYADRQLIERQLARGIPKREIAQGLGLSLSGLYRELSRLGDGPYRAEDAQRDYQRKRDLRRFPSALTRFPGLAEHIGQELFRHGRTPAAIVQQINDGGTPFPPNCISVSTIYNHLNAGTIPGAGDPPVHREA